jgi:hypothetical protein
MTVILFNAKIHFGEPNMAKKFDGIIEAVHYKNGQIVTARVYERRGASFSDRFLIDRKDLIERIKSGKKFLTGSRREFLASEFEVGKPVLVVSRDGKEFLSTREGADRDELEQVPVF